MYMCLKQINKLMLQTEMQLYIILSCDVYSFGNHTTDHCQPCCLALTRWAKVPLAHL